MPTQRWQTKPRLGTRINPAHPLSQGLIGAWLLNENAGVTGNNSMRSGPNVVANGAASLGLKGLSVTAASTSFGSAVYNAAFDSTVLTVATCFSMAALPGGVFAAMQSKADASSSVNGFNLFGAQGATSVAVIQVKGAAQVLQLTGTHKIDDGNPHIVTFSLNGILPAFLYLDSVLEATGTPSGSWDFTANGTKGSRWGAATDTFWNPEPVTFYWTYWYNRVLSQSEVIALQYDPYAMFQRPIAMGSGGVIPAEILCSMWGPSYPDLLFDRLGVVPYGEI